MNKIRNILIQSQLFGGLPDEHLAQIETVAVPRHYDKGEAVFHDGDEGIGFYLVVEGIVNVYKLSPEGKEQILHIVREGDTIGAVPVFSGKSFPANARALTECRLLFFNREKFIRLITQQPSLTMNILALLSARLREFTVQVENLSLKEIPARLASYLLDLSREQGNRDWVSLDISKLQLAGLLGTGPESLSRALGGMKRRKMIEEKNSTIRLVNRTLLKELAEKGKNTR
ncbi:MAG TPA: Crp/Fnr family transcriptional regulator [Smithellaceae bacterium]|nr:Crp/Fnr family transcriptional regulator [Smithellaceae bacterium]